MQAQSPGTSEDGLKVYNDPQELADLIRKIASQPLQPPSAIASPKRTALSTGPPQKRVKTEHSPSRSAKIDKLPQLPPRSVPTPPEGGIPPLIPSLFAFAVSARLAASTHLQQVFIPASIYTLADKDSAALKSASTGTNTVPFRPDAAAAVKSFGLLVLALDALRTGLTSRGTSERDKVFLGLEFGCCAVDVLRIPDKRLVSGIDVARLRQDAADAVSDGLSIARRYQYLRPQARHLELLAARLRYSEEKYKIAPRWIKDMLTNSESGPNANDPAEVAHRYALILLALEHADCMHPAEVANSVDELATLAKDRNHREVLRLTHLIRLHVLFRLRKWSDIPAALDQLGRELDEFGHESTATITWHAHLQLHYLLYRALWQGREGKDTPTKTLLKKIYVAMDQAVESDTFSSVRQNGGCMNLAILSDISIDVCVTPPNIVYLMAYLVSLVCRRGYLGSTASCRNLILAQSIREFEDVARSEDMWDLNFGPCQSAADAQVLQREIVAIRIEVMLEEVTALMFRGDDSRAEQILAKGVLLARQHQLLADLAPHFCFTYAQFAHLLGRDQAALGAYNTSLALLVPGSELGLLVEVCKMACEGHLTGVLQHPARAQRMRSLVERCIPSSNANIAAGGQFMLSLLEPNRVASKKRLTTAYGICQQANNNVLRCLIFAFTTSVHLYGNADTMLRQLETGQDLAKLMGGKDRSDGVGQLALGLWFSEKMKEYYRRDGNAAAYEAARAEQQRHLTRLAAQRDRVPSIPCNTK